MCPMIAFLLGVTVASYFPATWDAAMHGAPWLLLLGGLSAVAPDWLSGLCARSPTPPDMSFTPDPCAPSPDAVADALVTALYTSQIRGTTLLLQFNSVATAPAQWWQYRITLCARDGCVRVSTNDGTHDIERIVSVPFHAPPPSCLSVEADRPATLSVAPRRDGALELSQCSHEPATWSHSLCCAVALSLIAAVIAAPTAAGVMFAAYVAHMLVDQLGHEPCVWWLRPVPGLRWLPRPGAALDAWVLILCSALAVAGLHA